MNLEKNLDKTKGILYTVCGIMIILSLLIIYLIVVNIKTAESVNPKLVQVHSAQLNLEKFNEVLKSIKQAL